ncbi:IQ-domain 17 [Abeliophyllum distichum]|uniref:IQ-domain 17 n=1 Tax=Abeliophyllum distichum TaxID=126358 RepID=A0ABD1US54_9LAMI
MGKTGEISWLTAMKRAFRSPVKENDQRNSRRGEEHEQEEEEKKRGKRRWILPWKPSLHETTIQHSEAKNKASPISTSSTSYGGKTNAESEQRCAIAVAMATTATAEAAVATAQAAVEIIRLTRPSILVEQRQAAIVIQTFFRGYLARRARRALKGVVMLQSLIRGYNVRKRAKMTLQCMQSLVLVQTRVCDQRRRLSCEGSRGSMFLEPDKGDRKPFSRNVSGTADDSDENSYTPEEIQALIQKAKEFSLKHGNTLAHAVNSADVECGPGSIFRQNNDKPME